MGILFVSIAGMLLLGAWATIRRRLPRRRLGVETIRNR
jgi:hypothetical protein